MHPGGFYGCISLTEITVSDDNPRFVVVDNVVYSKDLTALVFCPPGKEELVIPDSVTTLNYFAINTFSNCARLKKIHIGSGVINIDLGLFHECYNLEELTVSEDNPMYKSVDNVIYTKDETQIITWITSKTEIFIPDTVTTIDPWYLFGYYFGTNVTEVIFENPNGWSYGHYYDNGDSEIFSGTAIPAADLSDPTIAAQYLTDTYVQYVWVCE